MRGMRCKVKGNEPAESGVSNQKKPLDDRSRENILITQNSGVRSQENNREDAGDVKVLVFPSQEPAIIMSRSRRLGWYRVGCLIDTSATQQFNGCLCEWETTCESNIKQLHERRGDGKV